MTKWRKLQGLSLEDWAALAEALILHPLVSIALRLLPFPRVLAFCQGAAPIPSQDGASAAPQTAARLTRLVGLAGRISPVASTCLTRALVASALLRRRGIACRLRIGVARRDGALQAHAWLEHHGLALPDKGTSDGYEALAS